MDTPKHLMAIAASNHTEAVGNVNCETAKNDDCLYGAFAAHRESRYRPKAAVDAENTHVSTPGIIPPEAMACNTIVIDI